MPAPWSPGSAGPAISLRAPAPTRSVAATPSPLNWAINWSTGPPGAAWMTMKLMIMIPSRVGMMSNRRRMM